MLAVDQPMKLTWNYLMAESSVNSKKNWLSTICSVAGIVAMIIFVAEMN